MRAIVSRCLLGAACRYDGGSKPCDVAIELARKMDCRAGPRSSVTAASIWPTAAT